MSAYEQKRDLPDKRYQYLLVAALPFETVAFKIPAREVDRAVSGSTSLPTEAAHPAPGTRGFVSGPDTAYRKLWTHWDPDTLRFTIQFLFIRSD